MKLPLHSPGKPKDGAPEDESGSEDSSSDVSPTKKDSAKSDDAEEDPEEVAGAIECEQFVPCSLKLLVSKTNSRFAMDVEGGYFYSLRLAPNETYVAASLHANAHGRQQIAPDAHFLDPAHKVTQAIPPACPLFIDSKRMLHVTRPGVQDLPQLDWSFLLHTINICGEKEVERLSKKRSNNNKARRGPDHMSRIHHGFVYAGDINQYCGYDVPNKKLVEAGYSNSNIEKFWKSIGILASCCYRNGCALHEASGEEPMCPDEDRDLRFASKVRDKLGIAEPKDMRMEVVIPSCYEILPMPNDFPLDFHFDEGNDRSKGYEKCLCTSVPVVNSTGDKILLFQIILACRKSICQHLNKQKKGTLKTWRIHWCLFFSLHHFLGKRDSSGRARISADPQRNHKMQYRSISRLGMLAEFRIFSATMFPSGYSNQWPSTIIPWSTRKSGS